jgi:hypothetical protein
MGDTESAGEQASAMPDVPKAIELTYTADEVVKQYLALRETKKAIVKRHIEELAPYKAAMDVLEGYAAIMMRQLNTTLSTPHGSAFWVRSWSYRCEDFEKFWPWVVKEKQQQMLTRHVSQDAISDWIEVQKAMRPNEEIKLPPGLTGDYNISVQFRKG